MNITGSRESPWILLIFSLPAGKASERVQVWRKLQRFGCIAFRNAGYLLPNTPENRERLIWVSKTVRTSQGEASVLEVSSVDDLNTSAIRELFRQAREADYAAIEKELRKLKPQTVASPQILRLRKRFDEVVEMDFFDSKRRIVVQTLFDRLTPPTSRDEAVKSVNKKEFQRKSWVTRPRPGIDRVSSAWLIARFIDEKPRFAFAEKAEDKPRAVPFDMYGPRGFGHVGDRCTFETLCDSFSITDKKVLMIAEAIHDADMEDRKFGREDGLTINRILHGWAKQGLSDDDLLKRGMDLVEGLYGAIS